MATMAEKKFARICPVSVSDCASYVSCVGRRCCQAEAYMLVLSRGERENSPSEEGDSLDGEQRPGNGQGNRREREKRVRLTATAQ